MNDYNNGNEYQPPMYEENENANPNSRITGVWALALAVAVGATVVLWTGLWFWNPPK